MTLVALSRSIRWPKLLQPRPTSETRRPDLPRFRSVMFVPYALQRRDARMRPDRRQSAGLRSDALQPCGTRAFPNLLLVGCVPDRERPDKQKRRSAHRPEGRECSIRSARPRGSSTGKSAGTSIGLALSLVIIVSACVVLYRTLRGIRLRPGGGGAEGERAARHHAGRRCSSRPAISRSPSTTCSRCARSARTTCRIASPRSAGSCSYSVGHNIGATVFTGGAVRYRIYSAWGLTAIDVAKICFIAGLTFWLGNATVLGLGIAYEPQAASAIDQLPPWFNRIIAFVALGVLAGYVAWVWAKPRVIGRADWTVTASRRAADAAADRDRHHRSRLLRARHVRAAAGRPAHRLHQARGDLRLGDAARLRQPLARRARRVRRRDAGRADRVQQGRAARRTAAVPAALLCYPVRAVAR